MRCVEPVRIIEILRLWEQGYSQREIASSVKCAKSSVGEVQKRCRAHKLTYQEASGMTDNAIRERLYPGNSSATKAEPDYKCIHERLTQGKRLNLQYVWEEYRLTNESGLGYSQFCRRYRQWLDETGKNVVMAREREPGKELFVDWMGDTLSCITDSETGEILTAHFFVATLGDSNYPYVEAFLDEKLESWLNAHVHALAYYGGVPRVIVPDNTKTAVTTPRYYDPKINPAYWDLARHYDVAVLPARIRKPKDKSPVEGSVGWLETWLLEWLSGQQFFSVEELNRAIMSRVRVLSKRPFQKRAGSRESVFEAVDKPALRALPKTRYAYAEYVTRRVPDNYHVEYMGFYYSVPYALYRQTVTLRVTENMLEILGGNRGRVALHQRKRSGSRYVTDTQHMPENHRHQHKMNRYDGSKYRKWAGTVGANTLYVIDSMLKAQHVEETAYRSCMGVLQMEKKYGRERLEAACKRARSIGSTTYSTVKNILKNAQDNLTEHPPCKPLPAHNNLRGPASFI
jgi:transposase